MASQGPAQLSDWLRIGPAETFAKVREAFHSAGVDEARVLQRYEAKTLNELIPAIRRAEPPAITTPLDALASIFLEGGYVPRAVVSPLLGEDVLSAMDELGLLSENGERILASCTLAPSDDLLVVSDRWNTPERKPVFGIRSDAVYPAHTRETREFLAAIPDISSGDVLDLGSGTGILGMVYAQRGCRVVATDLAERCCTATEFNFRLNGLPLEAVLAGDCFVPVQGRQFDLIVCHPPYVPNLDKSYVCSDGGNDGEHILRTIVRQLPEFLRPGGLCHVEALSSDRHGAPVQERLHALLGEKAGEFDLGIFPRRIIPARQWVEMRGEEWEAPLVEWGVERFVIGSFLLRRHAQPRTNRIIRKAASQYTHGAQMIWAFHAAQWLDENSIEDKPLRISPHLVLNMTFQRGSEGWEETAERFTCNYPLEATGESAEWLAWIFHSGDGLTPRQALQTLQEKKLVPSHLPVEAFVGGLKPLIASGIFVIEELGLP